MGCHLLGVIYYQPVRVHKRCSEVQEDVDEEEDVCSNVNLKQR